MTQHIATDADMNGYVAPALVKLGSLEGLTLGNKTGPKTDAFFPAGTPKSDITFS